MQLGPPLYSNSCATSLVGKTEQRMAGACCCGQRRYVVGGGVMGKHQGVRAHTLGYPDWPDAACGGAATEAGGLSPPELAATVLRRPW